MTLKTGTYGPASRRRRRRNRVVGSETHPRAPVGLTVIQPSPGATTPARRLRAGLAALVGSAEPSAADLAR
jgi:hypothetical protein